MFDKRTLSTFGCVALLSACGAGGSDPAPVTPEPIPEPPNQAPAVDAGDAITALEASTVTLNGTASDSDGTISTYSWTQTSGTNVSLSSSSSASTSFTAPQVNADETLVFELTVTDDDGATSTDTVEVTVQNGQALTFSLTDSFETPLIGFTVEAAGEQNDQTVTTPAGEAVLDLPLGEYEFSISFNDVHIFQFNDEVLVDGTLASYGTLVKLPEDVELPHADVADTPLPEVFVEPAFPYSNQSFSVFVDSHVFTDSQASFEGPGCGSLNGQSIELGASSQLDGVAGASGLCEIVYTGLKAGESTSLYAQFFVEPTEVFAPAVDVEQGDFFYGEELAAATNSSESPSVTEVLAPGTLINGAVATFELSVQDSQGISDIQRVQFSIEGVDGIFSAPATIVDDKISINLSLATDFFDTENVEQARSLLMSELHQITNFGVEKDVHNVFNQAAFVEENTGSAPKQYLDTRVGARNLANALNFGFQLIDAAGNVSNTLSTVVNTQQVGTGSLQFSISWDAPTDVDLWVYEPSGERIYFGNRNSNTGGQLDLDSNAGCTLDNVNNENITWPNATPPAGEYSVTANHWSSCGGNQSNYVVTINNCGSTESYTGTLVGNQTDDVATITFDNCSGLKVAGKVFYEDFKPTTSGLSTTAVTLPVAQADVHVKRQSDDVILASGSTDSSGAFSIEFSNDGTPGYYIEVAAEQKQSKKNVLVRNVAGDVYTYKSPVYNEQVTPQNTVVRLEISEADNSGAFNIFDMGVKGAAAVRRFNNINPQEVPFVWPGAGSTSYWNGSELHILQSTDDSDEFDDMVILHEYGHYYQATYSQVSRGAYLRGCHSSAWAELPHKAWSEGMATFFAGAVKNSTQYIDTTEDGAFLLDMENAQGVPSGVYRDFVITNACTSSATQGTTLQTQSQNDMLSEGLVSAILWDLFDPANSGETYDTISNGTGVFNVFDSLSNAQIGAADARNANGVDLVDFMDNYCANNTSRGNATSGVEGILSHHQFPYDFDATCN